MARKLLVQVRPAGAASRPGEPRHNASLRTGRTPLEVSLGTTMMRRMIGRYKGFRYARMVAGVKVDRQRRW